MPDQAMTPRLRPKALPTWKKFIFGAVTFFLFFGLLELLLFFLGVKPVQFSEDLYLGFSGSTPLFVESAGGRQMETAGNKLRWFNTQSFAKRKEPGTLRIFCLGGSDTYGHPYEDPLSFCGILRDLLPAADPSRTCEVINAGGISYASYRSARLMEELIRYEPDLFILNAGHNEFLERRTYAQRIEAPPARASPEGLLGRSRVYTALRGLLRPSPPRGKTAKPLLPGEVKAILDESAGPKDYSRDDAWHAQVLAHYRFNLERTVEIARAAGAQVLLVVPAANLKDCAPFKSETAPGLTAEQIERVQDLLAESRRLRAAGQADAAARRAGEALALDERNAEAHYLAGQACYALERFDEAKRSFQRALDEDICPLRVLGCMQETVREVAALRNTGLYDFAREIERRSPHGIPDATFFLDHVHCTLDGYWMLALGILETLAERKWVRKSEGWNDEVLSAVKRRVESRLDKKAEGEALRTLAKVLSWAGRVEEAGRLAERAEALLGNDAEAAALSAAGAASKGELGEALERYRKALALDPQDSKSHFNLGVLLQKAGEKEQAAQQYLEALRIRPDFADAAANLAVIRQEQGQLSEAVRLYRQALSYKPDYVQVRTNLGRALLEGENLEAAAKEFQEALRHHAGFLPAQEGLADSLSAAGRFGEAIPHYRKFIAQIPDDETAQCGLAAALSETGNAEEGRAILRGFVRKHPDARMARELLATLEKAQTGR